MTKKKKLIYISIAAAIIVIAALAIIFMPKTAPQTVTEMLSTAQKYLVEMEYERAIAEFNKVIELDPMNADAYLGLAEAYEKSGDIDKAIETLKNGFELTGDERLQARLAVLTADTPVETQTSAEDEGFSAGDTEPMAYYSDGKLRSERIYTDDSGAYDDVYYYWQGFVMLRESYGNDGMLEKAKFTLPFYGINFNAVQGEFEGKPEKADGGYYISTGNAPEKLFIADSKDHFEMSYLSYKNIYTVDEMGNIGERSEGNASYFDFNNFDFTYNIDGTINGYHGSADVVSLKSDGSFSWTDGNFESEIIYQQPYNGMKSEKNIYSDGKCTFYHYSKSGRMMYHSESYADGDTYVAKNYDGSGNVVFEHISEYEYTDEGRHSSGKFNRHSPNDDFYALDEWNTYDEEGNLISKQYNENGTLTCMYIYRIDGSYLYESYDDSGNLTYINEIDSNGNGKYTDYNSSGEIISVSYSHYNSDGVKVTEYYDQNNRLYSVNEIDQYSGKSKSTYYDENGNISGYGNDFYNDEGIHIYEEYWNGKLSYRSESDDFNNTHKNIRYDENGNITDITED